MKPATGQTLRRIGLLLEALCMLGLLSVARGQAPLQEFAGLTQVQYMTAGLVLGFVLWFVGTAAIHWPRKSREPE